MAKFQFNNRMGSAVTSMTTTFKTVASVTAATATLGRARVFGFNYGADGPPNATDCTIGYDWSKCTSAGTAGTTVTPNALDPANSRASGQVCGINHSAEPTYTGTNVITTATGSVWGDSLNQRVSRSWFTTDPDSMFMIPATNVNGLGFRGFSPTFNAGIVASIFYEDL
jgi:hypothetical protein